MRFVVAGAVYDSDVDPGVDWLPVVDPVSAVDCTIRAGRRLDTAEVRWFDEAAPGFVRAGWAGDRFVLDLDERVQFSLSADGSIVRWWAAEDARHLLPSVLLDQVVPHRCSLVGELVLHGTAVAVGDRAVAFCGPSGAGKSTLAAVFATAGHPILADDALLVRPGPDGTVVVPTYAGTRLRPDALVAVGFAATGDPSPAGKHLLTALHGHRLFRTEIVRLGLLAILCDDGSAGLAPLSPSSVLLELLRQSFVADRGTPAGAARTFVQLTNLLDAVPLVRLSHGGDFAHLPDLVAAVIDRLGP